MSEQPAAEPAPPPARWSAGQAALVVAVALLAALVVVTLLGQAAVMPQSMAAAVNAGLLAVSGLVAALVGAARRRAGRWPEATTAYRLAMWCYFIAGLHAVKYYVAVERETVEARVQRALDLYRQQQQGDTDPHPEP
jgi:hypothetical protein